MSTTETGIGPISLAAAPVAAQQQWYLYRQGCSGSQALFNPQLPGGGLTQSSLNKGAGDTSFRFTLQLNVATSGGSTYIGYTIVSVASGMAVRFTGAGQQVVADVTPADAAGRLDCLWRMDDVGGGYFAVNNYDRSQVFDVKGGGCDNGTAIVAWGWNKGDNQRWRFDEASS